MMSDETFKVKWYTLEALARVAEVAELPKGFRDDLFTIKELAPYTNNSAAERAAELLAWYGEARRIAQEEGKAGTERDLDTCLSLLRRAAKAVERAPASPIVDQPPPVAEETTQERVDRLRAKVESYDGGDRPMSPPVALLQELADAEAVLRREREQGGTHG